MSAISGPNTIFTVWTVKPYAATTIASKATKASIIDMIRFLINKDVLKNIRNNIIKGASSRLFTIPIDLETEGDAAITF